MKTIVREICTAQLLLVPNATGRHADGTALFVTAVLEWLEATEQSLLGIRDPLAAEISATRATLLSARDGLRFDDVKSGSSGSSGRRSERAAAASALSRAQRALSLRAVTEDQFITEMTEKMAQLVAVATVAEPIPFPPTEPRESWLDGVWQRLGSGNGSAGMYAYLAVSLTAVDRRYILDGLLRNLEGNTPDALTR